MDMKISSTIGYERAHNDLLQVDSEDAFVERALATLGPQPPNFRNIVALNRGPLLTNGVDANPLTPRQVEAAREEGALVVDVRTELQFDDAHLPDSVCITALRMGFGSRLAWIADPSEPIVFIGRDDADAQRAVGLAEAVGVSAVAGYLAGGMTSWREEKRAVRRTERVTVSDLRRRMDADPELQVLDVRERTEWDAGHIDGSLFCPYHDLGELPDGLDPERPVAVICASGQRSAIGASLLERLGAHEVLHVVDGGVREFLAS
jgi:rhodanese-related sulfurtransferase